MLKIINNKTDGFLDDVLPGVELVAHEEEGDCPAQDVAATMQSVYANLRAALPNMTAVIGGKCSGALAAMTSATYRESVGGPPHLFISGSSTAPSIGNNTEFPNVIRTVASEATVANVFADFAEHNGWRRIGVVSTSDSVWSTESAGSQSQ